jgi:hypothetical protein
MDKTRQVRMRGPWSKLKKVGTAGNGSKFGSGGSSSRTGSGIRVRCRQKREAEGAEDMQQKKNQGWQ